MKKQPHLGRKIKELREEKGLTQKDLSFQCNISERTLQRIEGGKVAPRTYTVKAISEQLGHDFFAQAEGSGPDHPDADRTTRISLKKVLGAFIAAMVILFSYLHFSGTLERFYLKEDVAQIIREKNKKFIQLVNDGEADTVVEFYRTDACVVSQGCGKDFIRNYYLEFSRKLRFTDLTAIDISIGDSIAVEKGQWSAETSSGEIFGGEYITEWRLRENEWLIKNEISGFSNK